MTRYHFSVRWLGLPRRVHRELCDQARRDGLTWLADCEVWSGVFDDTEQLRALVSEWRDRDVEPKIYAEEVCDQPTRPAVLRTTPAKARAPWCRLATGETRVSR